MSASPCLVLPGFDSSGQLLQVLRGRRVLRQVHLQPAAAAPAARRAHVGLRSRPEMDVVADSEEKKKRNRFCRKSGAILAALHFLRNLQKVTES